MGGFPTAGSGGMPSDPLGIDHGGTGTATGSITAASGSPIVLTASRADGTGTQIELNSDTQITQTTIETFAAMFHKITGSKVQLFGWEARVGGAPCTYITFFNPLTGVYENGIGCFGTDGGNDERMFMHTKHILPETDKNTTLGDYFYDYRWKYVASYQYGGQEQTLATSGSVTFNPTSGEVGYLLATGNVTGITISAPSNSLQAQQVTLILKQKSDGVPTWPSTITNALLSGGTFSKTTTASAVNVLDFRWCVALSKWVQVGTTTTVS